MRRIKRMTWGCGACGAQVEMRRGQNPVVMRVIEPGNLQTRVVTVNGAVVHQCRIDARIMAGQLVLALA